MPHARRPAAEWLLMLNALMVAGTAASWFVWDFAFYGEFSCSQGHHAFLPCAAARHFGAHMFMSSYLLAGNKLFQGTFIKIINPKASLLEVLLWTALNSGVALIGYYFAAFTIDRLVTSQSHAVHFFCAQFRSDLLSFAPFLSEDGVLRERTASPAAPG